MLVPLAISCKAGGSVLQYCGCLICGISKRYDYRLSYWSARRSCSIALSQAAIALTLCPPKS
jgi:hypothetical protein